MVRMIVLATALVAIGGGEAVQAESRLEQARGRLQQAQQRLRNKGGRKSQDNAEVQVASATSSARAELRPDLVVSAMSASGDALFVTVQNNGNQFSPETTLRIDVKQRPGGQILVTKQQRVARLDPGQSSRYQIHRLPLGNVTVLATADSIGQAQESNEGNNQRTITTNPDPTSPAPPSLDRPDLIFTVLANDGHILKMSILNTGRVDSTPTTVQVTIRGRDGRVQDVKTSRVPAIRAGKTLRKELHNVVLNDVKVTATIDPEGLVTEVGETNNTRTLEVGDQTRFAADLVVVNIRFDRVNDEVIVFIRNAGNAKFGRRVLLGLDSFFGPGNQVDRLRSGVACPEPGQQAAVRFKPSRLNSGMQFKATIDVGNDVPEPNETNNVFQTTFN